MGKIQARRLDGDFKASCAAAAQAGSARNVCALLKANDDSRQAGASKWAPRMLAHEVAKMWLTWRSGGIVGLAPDGARFGNPGEDTYVIPCYHSSSGSGGWLPPQVECLDDPMREFLRLLVS